MEQYGKKGVNVESLINAKLEVVRKTYKEQNFSESKLYDIAFEEVVADAMEPMLTDGKVLQQLKGKNPAIWQRIKDAVLEMAEKIRKLYARLIPDSAEGRAVLQMKDAIEEIEKLFLEGLQDSAQAAAEGQKNTAQEGGKMAASARYSLRNLDIQQSYIAYGDVSAEKNAVDLVVNDQVLRGKVTKISPDSI